MNAPAARFVPEFYCQDRHGYDRPDTRHPAGESYDTCSTCGGPSFGSPDYVAVYPIAFEQ